MIARINYHGELIIEAESELELYALECWYEKHKTFCSRTEANGEEDKDVVITMGYTDKS